MPPGKRCAAHLMRDCIRAAGSRMTARRVARIVAPVSRLKEAGAAGAAYHMAIEMLGGCCRDAAPILEEAEPDAPACLDFPASHWERLRASNVRERTNREIRRRSRVVRVFPPIGSPQRLIGAVMCDQGEAWSEPRCFSAKRMAELYDDSGAKAADQPTPEKREEWRIVAKRAIEASLEPADELEAA